MTRYRILFSLLSALALSPIACAQTVERQAIISWQAPLTCTDNTSMPANCPVTGYVVQKQVPDGWAVVRAVNASTFTITDVHLPLGAHTYRVIAQSASGDSDPSTTVTRSFAIPNAPGGVTVTVTVSIQ